MLPKIKQSLRITHSELDGEISDLIDAAKLDLSISGIVNLPENDPLILRAVILYAKANFGLSNDESEKFLKGYTSLKIHLALCGDYNHDDV